MSVRRAAPGLIVLLFLQCGPEPFSARGLDVAGRRDVRLNQPLILTFSEPVEPASVHAGTVRVRRHPDGAQARGTFRVEGREVRFQPRQPLQPDAADAGLAAGRRYTVEVAGLPRLRSVRSLHGAPLVAGRSDWFETVPERRFVDPRPGEAPRLLSPEAVPDGNRVLLTFSEPLDPRALLDARFRLRGPWSTAARPELDPLLPARLRENQEVAVLELTLPEAPPLPLEPGAELQIVLDPDALRDLAGRPLSPRRTDLYVPLRTSAAPRRWREREEQG